MWRRSDAGPDARVRIGVDETFRFPSQSDYPDDGKRRPAESRKPNANEDASMADQTLARFVNELNVLTTLRTQGATSRAELSRRLDLTGATISRLVGELARRDLLREISSAPDDNAAREPGRPGVKIEINPEGAYFLGVEIGVGVMRFALLDLAASVASSLEIEIAADITPKAAVRAIAQHVDRFMRDARFADKIRSMGVTVPGLVTLDGDVVNLPILGWRDLNLKTLLRKAVPLPCLVENNATAAAFGSVYTLPSLPSDCTIFLKLGSGCGGAAIVNRRLLRGSSGTAGEFGHLRIAAGGPMCNCGRRGCLETRVNLAAMGRAYLGRDDLGGAQLMRLPRQIAEALKNGDPQARRAVASLTEHLGSGLVALVNIFNPSTIMLGGVMQPLIEPALGKLRKIVGEGIVPGTLPPDIRLSPLGIFECAIGAAAVAHHHSFDISHFDLTRQELVL